jgi:hypothetical protein
MRQTETDTQLETNKDKYEICDGFEEIFAMLFADPEGGEPGLCKLLSACNWAREDLEEAAVGLTDAGMHRAAKIVADFAKAQPSEDALDLCPWPEGTTNAKAWYAALPGHRVSRKWWRLEMRRRKRAGTG